MHYKFLLYLFLLSVTNLNAMITLTQDVSQKHLTPLLDEAGYNSLRISCQYFAALMPSQYKLNSEYESARAAQNTLRMKDLITNGTFPTEKKIYKLFIDGQKDRAKKMFLKHQENISKDLLFLGAQEHNSLFIDWYLAIPSLNHKRHLDSIIAALDYSTTLEHKDIIRALRTYLEYCLKRHTQFSSIPYDYRLSYLPI